MLTAVPLFAQWTLQDSHSKASLRGVHALSNKRAWVSGTAGTVLRTEDGGRSWRTCSKPPGGETLDFRAVQAFNDRRAVIMASGEGNLSRVYETSDGCKHWHLVFQNPDAPAGFFDALRFAPGRSGQGFLIGDPVGGRFPLFVSDDRGRSWKRSADVAKAAEGEALFAASNSGLEVHRGVVSFVSGGTTVRWHTGESAVAIPLQQGQSAGAFSVARSTRNPQMLVAVGGDYRKPEEAAGTAAFSSDGGHKWTAASNPPHGYRSAVAFDGASGCWVAVGTNGADVSADGDHWQTMSEAEGKWNAISLPFVIGSDGRIARLNAPRPCH